MSEGRLCGGEERGCFFGGLVAEGAGFVDLGGQFLNPRHHPPLLRQRWQGIS